MTDTEVSREVLAAVKRLAARGELSGASMADIASEAGITRVTLYRRGETRPAIIAGLREELLGGGGGGGRSPRRCATSCCARSASSCCLCSPGKVTRARG